MPIDLRVRAGSKNWHKARRSGIGASEIASVVGLSPYASPRTLYHRKRGDLPEQFDTSRMEWGRRLERIILDRFREDHKELRLTSGRLYRSDDIAWQLATPDAWAFTDAEGERVIVEVKTGASRDEWGDDGTDDIPLHYRCQVMQSMDVMNAHAAYVPVLFNGREYRCYVVEFDEAEARILRAKGAEFWDRIVTGNPPETDAHPTTSDTLKALFGVTDEIVNVDADLVRKLADAKRLLKRAQQIHDRHENALRALMGDASKAYADGKVVATRSTWETRPYTVAGGTRQRLNFKGLG